MSACIDQPISWLRLEMFALDKRDATIAQHVAACPACARCLSDIEGDVVALRPLAVPERRPGWRWLRLGAPAFALAAAAIVLLIVWRDRDPRREDIAYGVKGVGDVVLGIVRERADVTRDDVRSFAPGDRFKVVITCAPGPSVWLQLFVEDGRTTDHPLPPARVACGNRVAMPGAFSITGSARNRVCIRVSAADSADDARIACLTLVPE
jgi:hypothetical protein